MNYSDISQDIYYNDNFGYLEPNSNNDKNNLDVDVLCNIDTLYNEAMKTDANKYEKQQRKNNKEIEENINKMFLYNKTYYKQLIDQYKTDTIISLPQKNIDILNSIYRTKYDSGILDNVQFGENVTCNKEQLKAIRNCSGACSRNECNYENMEVILGNCRINSIPQSYGETFCVNESDDCLSIQKQHIESCSRDCYNCDANTSDITLGDCLINNIPQIYGDTFCSDNNVNICSREQLDYYERCKEDCNACNRILADTFMSNCTIDGGRPIYGHNYCINCNYYIRGDPTSCVSMKSLDNETICKYTPAGTGEVPASCKPINNPTVSDYSGFDGTETSCPEDQNYHFIEATPASTIRAESCSKTINCDVFTSNEPYSCASVESDSEQCIYNYEGSANIITTTPDCYGISSADPRCPPRNIIPFQCVNKDNELYYAPASDGTSPVLDTPTEKSNYYYNEGRCRPKDTSPQDFSIFGKSRNANNPDSNPILYSLFDINNKVHFTSSDTIKEYTACIECKYNNIIYDDALAATTITATGKVYREHTCQEIYDHSLGFCHPEFCDFDPNVCPENEGYTYVFGQIEPLDTQSESCTLSLKPVFMEDAAASGDGAAQIAGSFSAAAVAVAMADPGSFSAASGDAAAQVGTPASGCTRPSTAGYNFDGVAAVSASAETCLADAVTAPVTDCVTGYTAGDATNPDHGTCPTGCTQTAAVAAVTAVTGVTETSLGVTTFDVSGITCAPGFSGTAVAAVCAVDGGEYSVSGCVANSR